jgi:hypothetical protein
MADTRQAIRDSYLAFDIFGSAATEDANEIIASRTGEARGDITAPDEEGVNGFEAPAPLAEAISMATFAQTPEFRQILAAWHEMVDNFTTKSKDERLTQDARTFNHNKAVGIEQALVVAGDIVLAAQNRLKNTSTDERALMDENAKLLLSRLAEPPAPVVNDNRDALIEGAIPKFRDESPENAARKTREMVAFFERPDAPGRKS